MKKYLVILFLALMSCQEPCEPIQDTPDVEEAVYDGLVEGDGWELTLPESWQQAQPIDSNVLIAENEDVQSLVLLTKEAYTDDLDQFGIEVIRNYRGQQAEVVSTSSVAINEDPFIFVQTTKDDMVSNTWLTVKDNMAYSLSCGGYQTEFEQFSEDCQNIADSLKIQ